MNFIDLTDYIANISEYDSDFEYNEIYEEDLVVMDSDTNSFEGSVISYNSGNSDWGDEDEEYFQNWYGIVDTISLDEEDYESIPKVNEKYYIGLPGFIRKFQEYILLSSISAKSFLNYNIGDVCNYLTDYSISYITNPSVQIMKLFIQSNGVYNVVLKTHWLRLVQRRWKNIYKERQKIIIERSSIKNILLREINGRYNNYLDYYPSLTGMLNDL